MTKALDYIDGLDALAKEAAINAQKAQEGLLALRAVIVAGSTALTPQPLPASIGAETRAALAAALRGLYGPLTVAQWEAVEGALDGRAPDQVLIGQVGLTRQDFDWAVVTLKLAGNGYAKVRAVDEVESNNGGMMDAQAAILALDGPGGFIDGSVLPKILFEAHWFDRFTKGKFRASHPNLSSAKWNKALYVGGQGEWERLYKAMKLDEEAALKSASWGRYQIMGFNHVNAGYPNVRAFVDAMKQSERKQLEAFVNFVKNEGHAAKVNNIGAVAAMNNAFTTWYNGPGQVPKYSALIAKSYAKYA